MNKQTGAQNGSAMLTVLGIVAVVSIVCAMLGATANTQTRSTKITRDMLKARMIAESGLNKAYNVVKGNFALAKSGYQLTESFGGGTYTVKSVALANASADRAQLVAEGTCGLGSAKVSADLENRPFFDGSNGSSSDFYALDFDLLVGGVMALGGNFGAHVVMIHSNGNADLGGSANIDAMVVSSAGTVAWKKMPANVTLLPNQPARVIYPASLVAAINKLKAYAQANNAVYSSGSQIPAAPPGGVAYCTGSDSGWSGDGTGCFIFEGVFSGKHLNVTSVNNYPSIVVLSPSDIKLNAGTVLTGAVLLPNSNLTFNGHAAIYGPLLIGQALRGLGTADLYEGGGQGFSTPPQPKSNDRVVITAWH